ncbi:sensor histidine kinase [Planomonospora algeriensis]
MELVRNAYDADATKCTLELSGAGAVGGKLVVRDDGDGMTAEQLASGFLLIGRSGKSSSTHTKDGRRKVGEKGLGRVAALRLGRQVEISTRSVEEPGVEHMLSIDWDLIDSSEAVEDVPLTISSRKSSRPNGTEIVVTGLRQAIEETNARRLARSLLLLSGPFPETTAFRIECDAPEFRSLLNIFDQPLTEWYEYRLVAKLDSEGQVSASLFNWRGEEEFSGNHSDVALVRPSRNRKPVPVAKFDAPEALFELWMFNLNPGASKEVRRVGQATSSLKDWLASVGGVHLYHRGLRVQPYGDPTTDWLNMNLKRAVSPELRPSTNNSVGRLIVDDPDNLLRPKTDRSGFLDNLAFDELRNFATCALDWAATQRLTQREQRRVGASKKAENRVRVAEEKFQNLIEAIKPSDSDMLPLDASDPALVDSIVETASELMDTLSEENRALREDLLLYRTLASVGTSTSVFAHEALKPAKRIITDLGTVRRRIQSRITNEEYERSFREPVDSASESAETLETFAQLPLRLLEKRKRDVVDVEIDSACEVITALLSRYLDERDIRIEFDLDAPGAKVRTTIADLQSILSNLLANAAHAFTRQDAPPGDRVIRIRTRPRDRNNRPGVTICVDDTGPGIRRIPIESIWLPGKTTRDNGTGLGLTIVRDIVADLGGIQEAKGNGELGGARIIIWLPTLDGEGAA